MTKPIIYADADGMQFDLLDEWLSQINNDHGTSVTKADVRAWDVAAAFPSLPKAAVYGYLRKPGLFRNLKPIPGALQTMEAFHRLGYELHLVSTPSGPLSAMEKLQSFAEHLPFVPEKNIWLGHQKHMIHQPGAILLDDHPGTLVAYREAHPDSVCIGIRYPYNEHLALNPDPLLHMADDYRDTFAAWGEIFGHVMRWSA